MKFQTQKILIVIILIITLIFCLAACFVSVHYYNTTNDASKDASDNTQFLSTIIKNY